MMMFKNSWKNR